MNAIKFSLQESMINRKGVLGTVLGIAVLVYEVGDRPQVNTPFEWIFSFCAYVFATLLIIRPSKNLFWVGTAGALTCQILSFLPLINNHSTLFAALSVAILVSMAVNRWSPKGDFNNWFERSESFFRLIFLLGYGSAAIAKLNSGFFNSSISCANSMAKEVYGWFPAILPVFDLPIMPYIVASTELFVFLGLIFKVTRPWAIAVSALFHIALSLNLSSAGIAFNPALYATLPLFLSIAATDNLVVFGRNLLFKVSRNTKVLLVPLVALVVAVYCFFFLVPLGENHRLVRFIIAIIFSAIMTAVLITGALRWRRESLGERFVSVPSVLAWVTVGVIVLNSASPYLGGKTGSTFTMFSNLRVEGGTSNHFLIPRLPIKTEQDNLVEIRYSSSPKLMSFKENGEKINWLVLQQLAQRLPNDSVSYVKDGKLHQVAVMGEDKDLTNIDPIAGNLFWYRYVPKDGRCEW